MSLYICNPDLNRKCKRKRERGICQKLCILTTMLWCSQDAKPLTEEEVEEYENLLRERVEPGLRIGRHVDTKAAPAAAVEEEPDTEIDKTVIEEEAE